MDKNESVVCCFKEIVTRHNYISISVHIRTLILYIHVCSNITQHISITTV